MSNAALFVSACFMVAAHALAMSAWRGHIALRVAYAVGTVTSVVNHATTSAWTCACDRAAMAGGFCLDIFFIVSVIQRQNAEIAVLVIGSVLSYAAGKETSATILHVFSHALITLAHCLMLLRASH